MRSLLVLTSIASIIVTLITPIPGRKYDLLIESIFFEFFKTLPANIRPQLEMDTHHVIFQFSLIWKPSIAFKAAIWHFAVIL